MKILSVIQHTSAEYLGLMEDHLEGRQIRFKYYRPFVEGNPMPDRDAFGDGLVLLGGGPWGAAGVRDVPTLADELTVTKSCLMQGKPIIAIGLGATILAMAAGGSVKSAPFTFSVGEAKRVKDDALNGYLPETFPHVVYMRDAPVLPDYAESLYQVTIREISWEIVWRKAGRCCELFLYFSSINFAGWPQRHIINNRNHIRDFVGSKSTVEVVLDYGD